MDSLPTDSKQFTFAYFLQEVLGINAELLTRFALGFVITLYLIAIVWTFKDASRRYDDSATVLLWTLSVLVFNVFGLIAYLIFRPDLIEEEQQLYALNLKALKYYAGRVVPCPRCHADNVFMQEDKPHKYCWKCGTDLFWQCKECGASNLYINKYCVYCGVRKEIEDKKVSKKTRKSSKKR